MFWPMLLAWIFGTMMMVASFLLRARRRRILALQEARRHELLGWNHVYTRRAEGSYQGVPFSDHAPPLYPRSPAPSEGKPTA